jgi:hypothetical protein
MSDSADDFQSIHVMSARQVNRCVNIVRPIIMTHCRYIQHCCRNDPNTGRFINGFINEAIRQQTCEGSQLSIWY